MEVTQISNKTTMLYLPGMFCGGWAWEDVISQTHCSDNVVVEDPLCAISKEPDEIVDQTAELLVSLARPVIIQGTSLGGLIAMKVAVMVPELVERVVIAASAGFQVVDLGYPFDRHNIDEYSIKLAHSIYHNHDRMRVVDLERLRSTLRKDKRAVASLMNKGNKSVVAHELLAELQRLGIPVHAIWGRNDSITQLEHAELVLRRFGVSIDVIENCGHAPMREAPDQFAECLNRLIVRDTVDLKLLA